MKIPKDQIKRKKNTKTTRTTNQPIKQKMEKIQDNRKAKQKWKYKKIYILKKKKDTKLMHRNLLHSYILTMKNLKVK